MAVVVSESYEFRMQFGGAKRTHFSFFFADVRSYVKEVIMNLVTVHAQVSAESLHTCLSLEHCRIIKLRFDFRRN